MTVAFRNNGNALALPDDSDHAAVQLIQWAQAADAAFQLADRLCSTQFAPAAYRGKVAEATAAIIAGAEVGLSPMASLRAFDVIQGTPAPKAVTLRAIVQSKGHEVRIDKSTADLAVVSGRRKGDEGWQTSTWDIARARQMGLTDKSQWKQQPGAMLVARATAEVCRWIASDAIMGMPYTAEEVYDQDAGVSTDRPAPRRVRASDILDEQPPTATAPAEPISDVQRKRMFALWDEIGYGGEDNRDQRLVIIGKILGLDGPVESSSVLTFEQADAVIAALDAKRRHMEAAQAQQAEEVLGGDADGGES